MISAEEARDLSKTKEIDNIDRTIRIVAANKSRMYVPTMKPETVIMLKSYGYHVIKLDAITDKISWKK